MSNWKEHVSWGRDVVLQCESVLSLIGAVFDLKRGGEQVLSTSLTCASWKRLCAKSRLVLPQLYLNEFYYLFHIL
jgi:hypothetical protein